MAMLTNQMVNPWKTHQKKNVSLASPRRISKFLLILTSFDPDLRHVSSSLFGSWASIWWFPMALAARASSLLLCPKGWNDIRMFAIIVCQYRVMIFFFLYVSPCSPLHSYSPSSCGGGECGCSSCYFCFCFLFGILLFVLFFLVIIYIYICILVMFVLLVPMFP